MMTDDQLELKGLTEVGVTAALGKAQHYRLLNEPLEAESICHDVLAVQPNNVDAIRSLILALTDQFGESGSGRRVKAAEKLAQQIPDPYERTYLRGLIAEREAKAYLARSTSPQFAYGGFRAAMELYEEAESLRPEGNDDAILRYNCCLRIIRAENLRPAIADSEIQLQE